MRMLRYFAIYPAFGRYLWRPAQEGNDLSKLGSKVDRLSALKLTQKSYNVIVLGILFSYSAV